MYANIHRAARFQTVQFDPDGSYCTFTGLLRPILRGHLSVFFKSFAAICAQSLDFFSGGLAIISNSAWAQETLNKNDPIVLQQLVM